MADDVPGSQDNLLRSQRHEHILELLRERGQVHATALAQAFGVSAYTIRRDLDELAESHQLERVHGGAVLASPSHRTFAERQEQFVSEKSLSAQAALTLLEEDQIVIVDGGSTATALADLVPMGFPATFVTHVPSISTALLAREPREVIVLGGRLDTESRACVGAETVGAYGRITADLCFLGVWALNVRDGICAPHYEESLVRRAMTDSADKVCGLAVGEKLGTGGGYSVAPASELTHLSVEPGVADQLLNPFRRLGTHILQNPPTVASAPDRP
jgi:DeoR/GlpR family transcriptional regulator of sugar metabolism